MLHIQILPVWGLSFAISSTVIWGKSPGDLHAHFARTLGPGWLLEITIIPLGPHIFFMMSDVPKGVNSPGRSPQGKSGPHVSVNSKLVTGIPRQPQGIWPKFIYQSIPGLTIPRATPEDSHALTAPGIGFSPTSFARGAGFWIREISYGLERKIYFKETGGSLKSRCFCAVSYQLLQKQ